VAQGADTSLLRKGFDVVEGAAGRRLEEFVRTGTFAEALGLATRARAGLEREVERRTRRALHVFNLPAASDVTRLRRQVASLDHEVRRLTAALERAQRADRRDEEAPDAGDRTQRGGARAGGAARPRPARRAPQRPPRS